MDDFRASKVAELTAAIENNRGLPPQWYTDERIFEMEMALVFGSSWQYAGHRSLLDEPGDFFTCTIGRAPVVVVLNQSNEVKAFLNICRHRQHEVAMGSGNRKSLQCHYHGWTYDLDGNLRAAPRAKYESCFNVSDFPLKQVRLEAWGDLMFVNLDEKAEPLAEVLGGVPAVAAARGLRTSLPLKHREEYIEKCNWKIWMDNTAECYHCATVHPSMERILDTSYENFSIETHGSKAAFTQLPSIRKNELTKDLMKRRKFFTKAGDPQFGSSVEFDAVAEDAQTEALPAHFYSFWPTLYISGRQDNFMLVLLAIPLTVTTTRVIKMFHADDSYSEDELGEIIKMTNAVLDEDSPSVQSVQRGLRAGLVEPGPLFVNSGEEMNKDLERFVLSCLRG